jgi:uncharacterized protein (TIGR03435 family)
MMHKFAAALVLCISVIPAYSQAADSPKPESDAKPLSWDVVSIKPHKELDSGGSMYVRPDGIEINNLTIHTLLWSAFDVKSQDQFSGWPSWADSDHFDIRAKVAPEDAERWHNAHGQDGEAQYRRLMHQILEDRFAFKAHIERRELPVYELVVAKQGSKLKESTPNTGGVSTYRPGSISAKSTRMVGLVVNLSGQVGRVVIDKTGLTGQYDIALTWAPDNQPDAGPSIFTALQEQLGLKLQSARAPVDVVVIDHIERPSEN